MFLETVNHWIEESAAICRAEPKCFVFLAGLDDSSLIPDQEAKIHPYY